MELKLSEIRESDKSLKHELGTIFKILSLKCASCWCCVAFWSLIQEVADSNPFTVLTNINILSH